MAFGIRPGSSGAQPGTHEGSATAIWDYFGGVDKVAVSVNGIPPAISEYIAYDTLNPPNPFIAVTQDGMGKVCYDGGFPKFYNNTAPPEGSTYASLNATFKYACNCLNWIANTTKVEAGNRKVLILGDAISGGYWIKGTGASDFYTTLQRLAVAGNWQFVFKDINDYPGGLLNATLNELEQYVSVVLFSTNSSGGARITDNCVTDLAEFRHRGGGLYFITDHGRVTTTIEDANSNYQSGSFFNTANKVMVNFGAWFSGDYNRTPVNVGFLRQTYGDHALYANLDNSQSIAAGGSESRVFVNESTVLMNPSEYPSTTFTREGINRINFLVMDALGNMNTFRFIYIIGNTVVIIRILDDNGNRLEDTVDIGLNNGIILGLSIDGESTTGTLEGVILRNTTTIGKFIWDPNEGTTVTWYGGEGRPILVNNNDVIMGRISSPFVFEEEITIKRIQPEISNTKSLGRFVNAIGAMSPVNPKRRIADVISKLKSFVNINYNNKTAVNVKNIKAFNSNSYQLPDVTTYVFNTTSELNNALNTLVPPTNRDIYTTWARISGNNYYPSGTNPPAGSEAASWTWDDALGAAVVPINSDSFLGFVSPESVDNYDHEVILRSNNADDDINGVIMAFTRQGNTNYSLGVVLKCDLTNNTSGTPANNLSIAVNTAAPLVQVDGDNILGGWRNQFKRIKVLRRGDIFTVYASRWNQMAFDPTLTMTLDLNSSPSLAIFKGPKPYGYSNFSQPQSYFSGIKYYGGVLKDVIIDALNNRVYRYTVGTGWGLVTGLRAQDIFGSPRILVNVADSKKYMLNKDNTITALT